MSQLVPSAGFYDTFVDDHYSAYTMCSMYPASATLSHNDIWDIMDEKNSLVSSLDGLHSGVPTRTTPTLTPTTLRMIDETVLGLETDPTPHYRSACFVPPLIEPVPSEPNAILIEPSEPTPAQTQNTAIHQQQQQQHANVLLQDVQYQQQRQQQQLQQQQQQQHHPQQQQQQQQPQQQQQQQQQHQQIHSPQQQSHQQQTTTTRRNMGGRRPTRTVGMTPEEEERRQIRRERNKMAAARCRKRRMDHTNSLIDETQGLEKKRQNLQDEIQQLQQVKEELEYMLESHRPICRYQSASPTDIKPMIDINKLHSNNNELQHEEFAELPCNGNGNGTSNSNSNASSNGAKHQDETNGLNGLTRLNRPNSLPIFTEPKPRPSSLQFMKQQQQQQQSAEVVAGIPITTPSSGIPFNFDSLMEGGTGLTPVSTPLVPSCSSQQRNNGASQHHHHQQQQQHHHGHHHHLSAVDLSSPDANPPKLVSL